MTTSQAQKKLRGHVRTRRLAMNWTQARLAKRSGVSLGTLRKFEQQGRISLESFLKLLAVLGILEPVVRTVQPQRQAFLSLDEIAQATDRKPPQRGRLT